MCGYQRDSAKNESSYGLDLVKSVNNNYSRSFSKDIYPITTIQKAQPVEK